MHHNAAETIVNEYLQTEECPPQCWTDLTGETGIEARKHLDAIDPEIVACRAIVLGKLETLHDKEMASAIKGWVYHLADATFALGVEVGKRARS